ncbi:ATPase family associated with various cellular activities (AAA) domain-containing protein [Hirsutella rhossiliensis]|uniref:ATPase family associated with various cellular activities (AAA) domain-containing protein n=1 Tax=Hirsutella rhossiliensis TaxID=111463 RepID=A0A9P8SIA1_9HYPO|nr:ATPase family associated with various cellular activities (AAA) domain-containing protein [Hirsutella rhossiliensis]KAH0963676.1 ATPase family associated with various cellular activities (AAA) domain-containing protein [Hirsutella rhossiliensis]
MGKVYFDMDILAEAKVIECSATELVGQYVGQTGPKVQQVLDRALGRILFIDEAYRLAGGGGFAKEAMDELVDSMTKPKYQGKMILILAGYVDYINHLLSVNPGMSSRFPESIDFDALGAQDCAKLLASLLGQKKAELRRRGKDVDMACLEAPSNAFNAEMLDRFHSLARTKGWGNARDVKQLAKFVFRRINLMSKVIRLEEEQAVRDAGVSDKVWNQLQLDRAEAVRKETEYGKLKKAQKSARGADRERIVRQVLEEEERRKREASAKARLKAFGVCPVGYKWIRQEGGYRCAGGSHWMSDGDLKGMK